MKSISLFITLLLLVTASFAEEDREFSTKTLKLKFDTKEQLEGWALRTIPFQEWLKAVSYKEWTELYSAQSDDFYFAIYRSGNHLIFCENDRKAAYKSAGTSLRAIDDEVAYEVVSDGPSMWSSLRCEVSYFTNGSGGSRLGKYTFYTREIVEGFTGGIRLQYSVRNDTTKSKQVLNQVVNWEATKVGQ